ncbi:MAG: FAD binding domain-containing protein [Coriobacteriales bacterium]|jgi:xanthine dehydrogenase YagS FAD-binding subunit|nr:FAD binding domain-containing protein [Coriobacteriales bacterium]
MKHFAHMDVASFDEAVKNSSAISWLIAGGTDLLGTLKDEMLRNYPEKLVNLKTIPDAAYIKEDGNAVRIGALTKVKDVAADDTIKTKFACLAEAAGKVASPTIRSMGTIGGNICQMHRCWYFRSANDRFDCYRKGGDYCPAMIGDSRYHSIFGNLDGCYAVSSQETAPALIVLGATVVTNEREIPAEEFFAAAVPRSNVLEDNEVVKEITVPNKTFKSAFYKFALRKSIDFALVSCAAAVGEDGAIKIALGGVYPTPWRSTSAEGAVGGSISADSAKAAGDAAVADASPLSENSYKVEIARALVERTLLAIPN